MSHFYNLLPGGARGCLEVPGGARRCLGVPGGAWLAARSRHRPAGPPSGSFLSAGPPVRQTAARLPASAGPRRREHEDNT